MTEENLTSKVNIGEMLKSAREKAHLSIDEVQKDTKIQKRYLVALENNDFAALPGKFYVRAFVKAFANAVGLNGDQFVRQYLPEENQTGEVKGKAEPVENQQAPTTSRVVKPTTSETEAKAKLDMRKYLPIGIIATIVVIVLIIVGFAVVKTYTDSSNAAPANSKVTVSNEDAKKKPKKKTTKKKTLKKGETKVTAVKNSPSDFTVQTGDETSKLELGASHPANATVKINGNQVWSGALTATQGHTVDLPKDTKDVNIALTNAPVSSVKLNDKPVVMSAPAQGQSATQREMNLKFND